MCVNTYLHQTFTECVSNRCTQFDLLCMFFGILHTIVHTYLYQIFTDCVPNTKGNYKEVHSEHS